MVLAQAEVIRTPHLADFGECLGGFADPAILRMNNHPFLGSVSLASRLLPNFRSQACRRVKQATPTGRQIDLFVASQRYYVMLVKSEVFQASHKPLDATLAWIGSKWFCHIKCRQPSLRRERKKQPRQKARAGQLMHFLCWRNCTGTHRQAKLLIQTGIK
jgi:hypothetical protein